MSITITADAMTSSLTAHGAACRDGGWDVCWLPGRALTQSQAVTAMRLTEAAAADLSPGDQMWPFTEGWAAKLGMTGRQAVAAVRWHDLDYHAALAGRGTRPGAGS